MKPAQGKLAFDRYTLDLESRELACGPNKVALQEQPFRLLLALLDRPGRLVRRQELQNALWPKDRHVDREAGLNTAMRKLRAALRQSGGDHALLETRPRLGYRLQSSEPRAVSHGEAPGSLDPGDSVGNAARSRFGAVAIYAALLAIALTALTAAWMLGHSGGESLGIPEPMPQDPALRASYLEARSLLGGHSGDSVRAREILRSLVEQDPEFAPAHAYLAEASARLAMRSAAAADAEEARGAALRARELDPDCAVAYRVLAMLSLNFDWDPATAGRHLATALDLDPGDPMTHMAHAFYESSRGRYEEAVVAVRRAVDLEPDSMPLRSDAGHYLLRAGRFREAARECAVVVRLDSDNWHARDCLVTAYSATGRPEEARSHVLALMRGADSPSSVLERAAAAAEPQRVYHSWRLANSLRRPEGQAVHIARSYLALDDEERALVWLERAEEARSPLLPFALQGPRFSELLARPRYREILQRAGLEALIPPAQEG
ncbi:MAG: winged helix-turn-helix domain-containing protein [Acidobacteriota bacterium]